jgi:hypothetical protein
MVPYGKWLTSDPNERNRKVVFNNAIDLPPDVSNGMCQSPQANGGRKRFAARMMVYRTLTPEQVRDNFYDTEW